MIQLLINTDNYDNKYMAYLLYDILSNDTNGTVDTQEQIILFDSFPWAIKQYFRDAMKKTGAISEAEYLRESGGGNINKPVYTLADAMKKTGAASEAEYLRESRGINITQNISYPTASVTEISAQTLSAIKFGTSGGYTSSFQNANSRDR